jgi:hypothetical protein
MVGLTQRNAAPGLILAGFVGSSTRAVRRGVGFVRRDVPRIVVLGSRVMPGRDSSCSGLTNFWHFYHAGSICRILHRVCQRNRHLSQRH